MHAPAWCRVPGKAKYQIYGKEQGSTPKIGREMKAQRGLLLSMSVDRTVDWLSAEPILIPYLHLLASCCVSGQKGMSVQKVSRNVPYFPCAEPALGWVELTLVYFYRKKSLSRPSVWCITWSCSVPMSIEGIQKRHNLMVRLVGAGPDDRSV